MGQKVNPIGFRLGYTAEWKSNWISSGRNNGFYLQEDNQVRNYLRSRLTLANLAVGDIIIFRKPIIPPIVHIVIYASNLSQETLSESDYQDIQLKLSSYLHATVILEVASEGIDGTRKAQILAVQLVRLFEKKKTINQVKREALKLTSNVRGAKFEFCGRFQGATMARRECLQRGQIPLQTLSVPIDYGFAEAHTQYGVFGIKVWLNNTK